MAFHPTLSSITWTRRTAGVGAVGCPSPRGVMASETSTMVSARTPIARSYVAAWTFVPTVGAGRGGQHHVRFTDLTDVGVDLRFRLAPRSLDDGDAVALLPPPHERLEGGPRRVGRRQPHHRGVGARDVDPGVPVEVALPGGFENRCRFVDDPWRGVCDGNARDGRRVGLGAIAVWQDLDVADEGSEPEGAQGVSDCRSDVVLGWQDLDRPGCRAEPVTVCAQPTSDRSTTKAPAAQRIWAISWPCRRRRLPTEPRRRPPAAPRPGRSSSSASCLPSASPAVCAYA